MNGGAEASTEWLGPGQSVSSKQTGPASPINGRLPADKSAARWCKHTKQIATVGPSCTSVEMLEKLFVAGVDVFRLNFSHGSHEEKRDIVRKIRSIEAKYRHSIGILADLQGPKLRLGTFHEDYVFLSAGQRFILDLNVDTPGDVTRVSMPHPEIFQVLGEGDTLLLDDGKVKLTVVKADDTHAECVVNVGGKLSARKGVNTPSVVLPISPLTGKDRIDLEAALDMDVDWVALSFVQVSVLHVCVCFVVVACVCGCVCVQVSVFVSVSVCSTCGSSSSAQQ
jgi:pyruvate kinase